MLDLKYSKTCLRLRRQLKPNQLLTSKSISIPTHPKANGLNTQGPNNGEQNC